VNTSSITRTAMVALAVPVLLATHAMACNTPVCQYALENWEASPYLIIVCRKGALTPGEAKNVEALKSDEDEELRPNVEVYAVDLAKEDDRILKQIEQALGKPLAEVIDADAASETPQAFVMWPFMYGQRNVPILWSGALDKLDFKTLTDSPIRRETAKRLLQGNAIVWLLAESGNVEADKKAEACLKENLKRLEGLIELPPPDLDPMLALDEQAPTEAVRPKFTMIKFKPGAPEESAFEKMLRIKDLWEEEKVPLAFPIYGRGRVLTALAGEEIEPDWIDEVSVFLTGPCSCQVKAGNPGYDLLMTVDWYGGLENRDDIEKALPPLISPTGMMAAVKAAAKKADDDAANKTEEKVAQAKPASPAQPVGLASNTPPTTTVTVAENQPSPVIRNTLFVVGGVVVIVALASLLMRSRRTQDT